MNPFSLGLLFAAATTFALALWVFLLRSNQRMHYIFILYLLSVGFWAAFSAVQTFSPDPSTVLMAARLMHWGAIFISVFFLHFLYYLTGKIAKAVVVVCYVVAFLLLVLNHTNLFVAGIRPLHPFHYFMTAGPLYPLYIVFFLISWSYAVVHLFSEMRKSTGKKRRQLQFLFAGSLIGYVGGSGAFLPVYDLNFPIIYPYGSFAIAITVSVMTYDIVRHGLMDIEVIIKKAIVFTFLFGAVFGAFVGIMMLTQELLAGGRLVGLALSSVIIILTVRPLENFLVNATDKFLFQKKYNPAELIRAFSKSVLTELDLNQITKSTIEKLTEILRVKTCAILIPGKEGNQFVIKDSEGIENKKIVYDKESPLVIRLNEGGGFILASSDKSLPETLSSDLAKINANVVLAITVHTQMIGMLSLGNKKSDKEYTKEDVDILLVLSDALGVAITNALAFENVRQKEKLVTIGTLTAGVKHDISTPINKMSTAIQAFLLDKEDGRHKKLPSEEILSEAYGLLTRAEMTFEKVVAISAKFADMASPNRKLEKESVNVPEMIDKALGVLDYEMEIKGIQVLKEIETGLPTLSCDKDYMQQILFNILRNAVHAVEEAKRPKELARIAVKVYQKTGNVCVAIEDTGTGIPADNLDKIFEAYYTTKPEGIGTGLGLAIVKELVERSNGTIRVESSLGKGTTFILEFKPRLP